MELLEAKRKKGKYFIKIWLTFSHPGAHTILGDARSLCNQQLLVLCSIIWDSLRSILTSWVESALQEGIMSIAWGLDNVVDNFNTAPQECISNL